MRHRRPSRLRRVEKWILTGTWWTLLMASGCLSVLLVYFWATSFSAPPQSISAVFGAASVRGPMYDASFHLRVLDRDSDWVMIAQPDEVWSALTRNICLYAESQSGRFIVGQMVYYGSPTVDQGEGRYWLQAIGRFPDYSGSGPRWSQFRTALPWKTVVYCNLPETANAPFGVRALSVSYWFATLISSTPLCLLLALGAVRRLRRYRRRKMNACPHCGYNLTGNESGVCSECSTPVPKQEATA